MEKGGNQQAGQYDRTSDERKVPSSDTTSIVIQGVQILQELSKGGMKVGGKVMLSPEENRHHYGNLLDEYSS